MPRGCTRISLKQKINKDENLSVLTSYPHVHSLKSFNLIKLYVSILVHKDHTKGFKHNISHTNFLSITDIHIFRKRDVNWNKRMVSTYFQRIESMPLYQDLHLTFKRYPFILLHLRIHVCMSVKQNFIFLLHKSRNAFSPTFKNNRSVNVYDYRHWSSPLLWLFKAHQLSFLNKVSKIKM